MIWSNCIVNIECSLYEAIFIMLAAPSAVSWMHVRMGLLLCKWMLETLHLFWQHNETKGVNGWVEAHRCE